MTLAPKHFWCPQEDAVTQETKPDAPLRFTMQATAGSSQPLSRMARASEADMLKEMGAISTVDLLKAHDWDDPEGTAQRAQEEAGMIEAAQNWQKLQENISKKSSPI